MEKEVVLYSKNGCGKCIFTKRWLDENQIPYKEINVSYDLDSLTLLKEKGYNSLPVVSINNWEDHWNGFNEEKLQELV